MRQPVEQADPWQRVRAHPRSQGDLERLQARLERTAGAADRRLRGAVSAQPLIAVAAAAGVGFVLGAGLPRGAVSVLLGVGARLAGAWLQQEFVEAQGAA